MALKPRINIYDVDLTTITGAADDAYDVAFIPGFTSLHLNDKVLYDGTIDTTLLIPSKTRSADTAVSSKIYEVNTNTVYQYNQIKTSIITLEERGTSQTVYQVSKAMEDSDVGNFFFTDGEIQVQECTGFIDATLENVASMEKYVDGATYDESDLGKYVYDVEDTTNVYRVELKDDGSYNIGDALFTVVRCDNEAAAKKATSEYVAIGISSATEFELCKVITPYQRKFDENKIYISDAGDEAHLNNKSESNVFYKYTNEYVFEKDETVTGEYFIFDTSDIYGAEIIDVESGKKFEVPTALNQSMKFTDLTTFKKAVGSSPLMVWKHTVYADSSKKEVVETFTNFEDANTFGTNYDEKKSGETKSSFLRRVDSKIIWVDTNWIYAAQLLYYGLPIFYNIMSNNVNKPWSPTLSDSESLIQEQARQLFMTKMVDMYAELADKGEYDVKYLTTGTFGLSFSDMFNIDNTDVFKFPFYEEGSKIENKKAMAYLVDIASYRKDAFVFLDALKDDSLKPFLGDDSVYNNFRAMVEDREFVNLYSGENYDEDEQARAGRRASNTFPWFSTDCIVFNAWKSYRDDGISFIMPGSYAYLLSLTDSLLKYESASWESIAGVTRALIPNFNSLYVNERLSNAVADYYNRRNEVGINAITNIRPYGYAIWGNRTLCDQSYFAKLGDGEDGLIASSFVDIMSMVCNVNKVAYRACKNLMFEKDNDKLWIRFTQQISPYLDNLQIGGALRTYTIQREPSEMRGQLVAKIVLWPTYSVENFDISIVLRDTDEN